jgi:hypothetical protein
MTALVNALAREEWKRRYAARIMDRAGWAERTAMLAAEAGAEMFEADPLRCGKPVVWEQPEEEADEEMSCWSDDEGPTS